MLLRGDAVEAEVARDGLAVEGEAAAGQRAGAERQHVGAAARLAEALPIAREHLEVRQQVVRPQHRLRAARVRVAGDDGVGIARGQVEQRGHHRRQQARARGRTPPAATAARRATPARCGCGRCGSCPPPRRPAPSACGSPACGRLRRWRPSKKPGCAASRADLRRTPRRCCARSSAVRMPTRSSARANACEPRISASISRRSKCERAGEALEDLRRPAFRTVRPRASFTCAAASARTFIGSPIRLMKPSASFWS